MNRAVSSIALAGVMSLSLVSAAGAQSHAQGHAGEHTMVLPSELKWADVPSLPPGAQIAVIEGP